jgi:hypothetical protein
MPVVMEGEAVVTYDPLVSAVALNCALEIRGKTEGPAAPVAPVGPVAPVAPVAPVEPAAPGDPVAPVAPGLPVGPGDPVAPAAPAGPVAPVAPVGPVGPVGPPGPVAPGAPVGTGVGAVNAGTPQTGNENVTTPSTKAASILFARYVERGDPAGDPCRS